MYADCDESVWMRTCEKEIVEPLSGFVSGNIPLWIQGSLLRNGPGKLKVGNDVYLHLFDSLALLHRISSIFHSENQHFDNAMISIYPFGDEICALTESPVMFKLDIETLSTIQKVDLFTSLRIISHTSHPHITKYNTVYNLGSTLTVAGVNYVVFCFPMGEINFKNAYISAMIPATSRFNSSYMHSFVSIIKALKSKLSNRPLVSCMTWYPEKKTKIHLLDRHSGKKVESFTTSALFYLHIINQYEEKDHIVVDICSYKDPSMLNCMYIETMAGMQNDADYAKFFRGRPLRFTLPLNRVSKRDNHCSSLFNRYRSILGNKIKAGYYEDFKNWNNFFPAGNSWNRLRYKQPDGSILCHPTVLCDIGCETPRINYNSYLGKKYRFFYAISSDVEADYPGSVIKVDIHIKKHLSWRETNCYPSEPIFVSSPDAVEEDDGIILSVIIWGKDDTDKVGLLCLCAKSLQELGRCTFNTPTPIPKCLHGWFTHDH